MVFPQLTRPTLWPEPIKGGAREHLSLNLAAARTEGLIELPDVPARIAKELIQPAVHKLSDVTAALATRLDSAAGARVWVQQTAWWNMQPDGWWLGVSPDWLSSWYMASRGI